MNDRTKEIKKGYGEKNMANLVYKIKLGEEKVEDDGFVSREFDTNLPHHHIIEKWLADEWNPLSVETIFSGLDIAANIESAKMNITKQFSPRITGINKISVALITIIPKKGFRWSKNEEQQCLMRWMHKW